MIPLGSVLIVDDALENLELLQMILENRRYKVHTVKTATEALEFVKHTTPELILLDINLPDMDGFQVCSALKLNEETSSIPVIFISGYYETAEKLKGFSLGGVDYITKPYVTEEVFARIQTHVLINRLQNELKIKNDQLRTELQERKKIEAHRNQLQAELLHSSKLASLGTLAAGVGHEINNPLAIVDGLIPPLEEIVEELGGSEEAAMIFAKQKKAIKRIVGIVDGLRTYARSDTDIIEKNINLNEIVEETLALCESIYKKQGIVFDLSLDPKLSSVQGNIGKLQQVVMNILANAKDACEANCEVPRLGLKTYESGGHAFLEISDNGIGISKENIEKIFDPFFTTKSAGKGTGLGLSISHTIIKSFKGDLKVRSELGKGTTFVLSLPLSLAEGEVKKVLAQKELQGFDFSGHVLLVEDEADLREILNVIIQSLGFTTTTVSDGMAAYELLQRQHFDYVFTDLKMPRMEGETLIELAKKIPGGIDTKFIIITGGIVTDYTKDQRELLRRLGDGYLKKPFTRDAIVELLKKIRKENSP